MAFSGPRPSARTWGPPKDSCPAKILDLLTGPSNEYAREWRKRCRARLARGRPKPAQKVAFEEPIGFVDGTEDRVLTFAGGSRFRSKRERFTEFLLGRPPAWPGASLCADIARHVEEGCEVAGEHSTGETLRGYAETLDRL